MNTLDEQPKGKQDYDKWIQDGKVITKGMFGHYLLLTLSLNHFESLKRQFEYSYSFYF